MVDDRLVTSTLQSLIIASEHTNTRGREANSVLAAARN
jgi:hypothetical protein